MPKYLIHRNIMQTHNALTTGHKESALVLRIISVIYVNEFLSLTACKEDYCFIQFQNYWDAFLSRIECRIYSEDLGVDAWMSASVKETKRWAPSRAFHYHQVWLVGHVPAKTSATLEGLNDVESLLERHTKITSSFCRKSQMCIGVRLKPRLCCHASSVFM